jgi:4'-phosphopantetheinyl transferase
LITTTAANQYKIVLIKIDQFFAYSKYLYLFSNNIQKHIDSFLHHRDKVTAFTSALLKYYYLPAMLDVKPTEVQIGINDYGKPYLLDYPEVDFSISHSGEYIVLAVVFGKKIGIDIEFIDKNIDLTMKSIIFSESECSLIDNYNDFFVMWTKKEAYLKCVGVGFSNETHIYCINLKAGLDYVELSQNYH